MTHRVQPNWSGPAYQIWSDVLAERFAQLRKWGEQHHKDGTSRNGFHQQAEYMKSLNDSRNGKNHPDDNWTDILLEEIYEALEEEDQARLRAELVQSAAVIFAWIEDIDSRTEQEAA